MALIVVGHLFRRNEAGKIAVLLFFAVANVTHNMLVR
jgi:hypothetical protein